MPGRTMTGPDRAWSARPSVRVFTVVFSVLVLWALASPMFASPDEPSHMVRAEAIVHGQVSGSIVVEDEDDDGDRAGDDQRAFRVSTMYEERKAPWADAPCYAFKADVPADCLDVPEDEGDHPVRSSAERYPPTFHLLAGWPTLFAGGVESLYLMRFANALVCAVLLTIAIRSAALVPDGRLVLVGLAAALTPMVLFVSGTVNPSGIAVTAGLAVWTGGVALSRPEVKRSLSRSAAACGGPFCLLLLVRRDSLVWGLAVACCLLVLIGADRLRTLARSSACRRWAVASGAVAVFQFVVTTGPSADSFRDGAADRSSDSGSAVLVGLGTFWELMFEAVGDLGWLDTTLPFIVYVVWLGVVIGFVLASSAVAPRRPISALLSTVALLVVIAVVVASIRPSYIQGRYLLPLAVGIPIVAATGIAARTGTVWVTRRMQAVILGTIWVMYQLSFGQHLRRYVVGHRGPLDFVFEGGPWTPPLFPVWLLVLAHMVATAALMVIFAGVRPFELLVSPRDGRSVPTRR